MFERVLVPLDGTAEGEAALTYGVAIAEKFGARVTLMHAYAGPQRQATQLVMTQGMPGGPDGYIAPETVDAVTQAAREEKVEARGYLREQIAALRARGFVVDYVLVDKPTAEAITDEAVRTADTLVVMATHGRGGLGRIFFGSVADEVVRAGKTPVLLIRVAENPAESDEIGGQQAMNSEVMHIGLGTEVIGTSGKLGEVSRVIVDNRSGRVTDLVVKHGFVFGTERVVTLSHVTSVQDNQAHVDLDEKQFEAMDGFAESVHGGDPDYVGTPDTDLEGTHRGNLVMDQMVAAGPLGAYGGSSKPMGYPGGEQLSPDLVQRPAVRAGDAIYDVNGDKVGSLGDLRLEPVDGVPVRITLQKGVMFKHETELPASWVREFGPHGLMLEVPKAEVEELAARD